MISDKDKDYPKVNGVELKFGDVLLLLPFKSDGTDGYYFSVPLYLYDAAYSLIMSLENKFTSENFLVKTLKHWLSFDNITKLMKDIMGTHKMRYLHVEVYLGNGWCIAATGAGVNLRRFSPTTLELFDVYRYKKNINKDVAMLFCEESWNKRYDTLSMSFNGFLRAFNVDVDKHKDKLIDTVEEMMCSEFGARLFNLIANEKIFANPEHTVPDDFAKNDRFECIFYDDKVVEKIANEDFR
jgi:hypothetical protein